MSFDQVCTMVQESVVQTFSDTQVELTQEEIQQAKKNKTEEYQKSRSFSHSTMYRTLHNATRLYLQVVVLLPKKTAKVSDILLQNLSDIMKWSAVAYSHYDELLKLSALEEAISLTYTLKIFVNSMTHLIGPKKHKQLTNLNDTLLRQLIAWRSSIIRRGSNDNVQ